MKEKEIQLSPFIAKNDLDIKLKQAIKFLQKGLRVRVVIKLRGRAIKVASDKMAELAEYVGMFVLSNVKAGITIGVPRGDERNLTCQLIFQPKK